MRVARKVGCCSWGVVACVASLLMGRVAHGYARFETKDGHSYYWEESCAPFTVYLNGFDHSSRSHMSTAETVKSVVAAAHAWSADAVSCPTAGAPYLELVPTLAPALAVPPAIGWDAKNTIVFRTDSWASSGSGTAYADGGLAITTVTARLDGHIVDADMEINAVDFTWMNLDPGVPLPVAHAGEEVEVYDLQSALTHEFGHFVGMAHSCFSPGRDETAPWPTYKGVNVPDCDVAAPSVMSPTMSANDVNKRSLMADDVAAVCDAYPASVTPKTCALDTASPGCGMAASTDRRTRHGHTLGVWLSLVGVVALARRASRARG